MGWAVFYFWWSPSNNDMKDSPHRSSRALLLVPGMSNLAQAKELKQELHDLESAEDQAQAGAPPVGLTGPTVEPESQFGRAKVDQTEIKEDGYQVSFDFVDVEGNRLRLTEEQVDCLDGDELQEFLSGMHDAQHCPFFCCRSRFCKCGHKIETSPFYW